jgi:NAD(P)-dependent dehydrogenase (short-subunit alcohol dehydrogenase family)
MTRWLLVTGVRRLGAKIALRAAAEGWSIMLHYGGSSAEAAQLAEEIRVSGGVAKTIQADFADSASAAALIERCAEMAGAPMIGLVNCAAIFEHDDAATFTPDALTRHFTINTMAPLLLTQALAAQSVTAQRSVVNLLDYKLAAPYQDHFSYTVSKFALAGATEMFARALAPHVRVNAVAPAYALPSPGQPQDSFERQHALTPLGYGVTPDDVAAAALYLLNAPAVTGQVIYVDAAQRFLPRDRDFAFFSP